METKQEVARRIFDTWKQTTNHPRACMDSKRQRLILDRLNDGYSEDDLKLAALGIANCPWNQGHNPAGRKYEAVELCYRSADKVDFFMQEGENAIAREKRQVQEKRLMEDASLRNSTTGEVYHQNRGALLSLVRKHA